MWSGALIDHFSALTEQMVGMSKIYIAGRPLHENFLCHRAFCDFGPVLAATMYRDQFGIYGSQKCLSAHHRA